MDWDSSPIGTDHPYLDGEHQETLSLREAHPYSDGSGYCYLFADSNQHCIVWFSKRKPKPPLEVGAVIRALFTIKSHRVYNGVLENVAKKFSIQARL